MFKLFMGDQAALQLSPGHEFYASLRAKVPGDVGVIYGGKGDDEGRNDDIIGDDVGTVGTEEAQLPEAKDAIRLPLGHTSLSYADQSLEQVLYFLKHRQFDHSGDPAGG